MMTYEQAIQDYKENEGKNCNLWFLNHNSATRETLLELADLMDRKNAHISNRDPYFWHKTLITAQFIERKYEDHRIGFTNTVVRNPSEPDLPSHILNAINRALDLLFSN